MVSILLVVVAIWFYSFYAEENQCSSGFPDKVESSFAETPDIAKDIPVHQKGLETEGPEAENPGKRADPQSPKKIPAVEQWETEEISGSGEAEKIEQSESHLPENQSKPQESESGRFSKLDRSGNLLPPEADSWSCVFGAETQLVWEVKTADSGVHNEKNRFVWFDPAVSNDVFSGDSVSENTCTFFDESTATYCNTYRLTVEVDRAKLCGFSSWRLPSADEFDSIIVGRGTATVVDSNFFPNIQREYYWTSEPVAYDDRSAWAVLFRYRAPKNDMEKDIPVYARLVAGGF